MSKEEREFLDELRSKSIEAAAEIMESLQRLKTLYEEISDDGSGNRPPRPRVGDFFYRLAKYELEHAANVLRLGNSQAELVFEHVRHLARRSKGGQAPTAVITLEHREVRARDGRVRPAFASELEIRNSFEVEADPRFEVGPLRDATGAEVPSARLEVSCGDGPVPPYQTARVQLALDPSVVTQTLFGDITVYLSASIEKQVARRAIKVRPRTHARGAADE